MTTMRTIVEGAAKRIGIIRAGDALSAEDGADILEALNDMLFSWEAKNINISYSEALALSGTFPLATKHEAGVKAMLAERMAGEFGLPLSADIARDARMGWSAVFADYSLPDPMQVDRALANMPSQRRIG